MTRGVLNNKLENLTIEEFENLARQYGSMNKAADALGYSRSTFKDHARRLHRNNPFRVKQQPPAILIAPAKRKVKRFIFSSAQNGTDIRESFMDNLEALAEHHGAEIHISGYTYNKSLFEDHAKTTAHFHPRVEKYLTNDQFDIAGKLLFCGEMNTLPTADDPLSGFEAYTRSKWGIFPHPRVQLRSIATMFSAPPKIIMSTGSVTEKNYIRKKAGIKAEFHHIMGAILVEVDSDGDFFCRHLLAEKDGAFQDLNTVVRDGRVQTGARCVEAITWGDIHTERLDPAVAEGAWGIDAETLEKIRSPKSLPMLHELCPRFQFFHDTLDFRRRNHHNIDDPHHMFEMWCRGTESVEEEIAKVARFLEAAQLPGCASVVVDSNHDRALEKWLKRTDYRKDPPNAAYFLECQARKYRAIQDKDDKFLVAEWAVKRAMNNPGVVGFLRNTDSFTICDAHGGIECALHGDKGANGSQGNVNQFARMGPKSNTADKHGAAIFEGAYQAGHSCRRDMVFNRGGLSSWNPSHILTYPNGKRTIITHAGTKWRA